MSEPDLILALESHIHITIRVHLSGNIISIKFAE